MYKKVIKRGGKSYVYYYHNKRINGKVRNICLGNHPKKAKKKLREHHKRNPLHHTHLLTDAPEPSPKFIFGKFGNFIVIILAIIFIFGFFYFFNTFTEPVGGTIFGKVVSSEPTSSFKVFPATQNNPPSRSFKDILKNLIKFEDTSLLTLTGRAVYDPNNIIFEVNQQVSDQAYILLNLDQEEYRRDITEFGLQPQDNTYSLTTLTINLDDLGIDTQSLEPAEYQLAISLIDNNDIIALQTETLIIQDQTPQIPPELIAPTPPPPEPEPTQNQTNITEPTPLPEPIPEPTPPEPEPTPEPIQNETNITIPPEQITPPEPEPEITIPSEPVQNITQPTPPSLPESAYPSEIQMCNMSSDCGENYDIGEPYCLSDSLAVRDRLIYYCPANNTCASSITQTINQTCSTNQTCHQGDCLYEWEIPANITAPALIEAPTITPTPARELTTETIETTEKTRRRITSTGGITTKRHQHKLKDSLLVDIGFDPWNETDFNVTQNYFNTLSTSPTLTPLTDIVVNRKVPFVERRTASTNGDVSIEIPSNAENITVFKISDHQDRRTSLKQRLKKESIDIWYKERPTSNEIKLSDRVLSRGELGLMTAHVVKDLKGKGFLSNLIWNIGKSLDIIFSSSSMIPTGAAIFENVTTINSTIRVENLRRNDILEVYYLLPAPEQTTQDLSSTKKRITINSDLHYENVTAYINLQDLPIIAERDVKLYHIVDGQRIPVEFTQIDTDNNGIYDYIEWTVPHLSEEEYELEMTILNLQSYPVIGGEWEVRFNTTGTANLTITATNFTTYEDVWDANIATDDDLEIRELKCGEDIIFSKEQDIYTENVTFILTNGSHINPDHTKNNSLRIDSIFVKDYNCDNRLGYHTVGVITGGDHFQKFQFGNLSQTAKNDAGTWYDTKLRQCKNIAISSVATSTLTDFPVYVNITHDTDMNANFSDLRFVDAPCKNGGSLMDYEVENYTVSNHADVWIRIPSLASTGTNISVYYGNSTYASAENHYGVWDQFYLMVQHMNEDPTTAGAVNIVDSTKYGRNYSSDAFDHDLTDLDLDWNIDGAFHFDEAEYESLKNASDTNDMCFTTHDYSIEVWTQQPASGGNALSGFIERGDYNSNGWYLQSGYGVDDFFFVTLQSGSNQVSRSENKMIIGAHWYHVTATRDGTTGKIYLQGVDATTTSGSHSDPTCWANHDSMIGEYGGNFMTGSLDELRVSNTSRSEDWINQSFRMVANHSMLIGISAEETMGDCADDSECAAGSECLSYYCFSKEGRFVVQNVTGDNLTLIDQFGNFAIRGELIKSCVTPAPASSFQIQNATDDVIYWISPENGSLCSYSDNDIDSENQCGTASGQMEATDTCAASNAFRLQNESCNITCITDEDGVGKIYTAGKYISSATEI